MPHTVRDCSEMEGGRGSGRPSAKQGSIRCAAPSIRVARPFPAEAAGAGPSAAAAEGGTNSAGGRNSCNSLLLKQQDFPKAYPRCSSWQILGIYLEQEEDQDEAVRNSIGVSDPSDAMSSSDHQDQQELRSLGSKTHYRNAILETVGLSETWAKRAGCPRHTDSRASPPRRAERKRRSCTCSFGESSGDSKRVPVGLLLGQGSCCPSECCLQLPLRKCRLLPTA